jgi:hypothetical protein
VAQLNQIIAVAKGVKSKAQRELTDAHHTLQKPTLLAGLSRTYRPKDEEGETLPPESTKVQLKVEDTLVEVRATLTRLFDVVATQDWANCLAKGDIVVDGTTLLTDVPVTYLLFLEKQLTDLRTFVAKLPTLDPAKDWETNVATGGWSTRPVDTVRTVKLPRNHVLAEATEKHPAQVQVYTEDVTVGTWTKVEFSGAVPATRVRELTERVDRLTEAVKFAREKANSSTVDDQRVGEAVLGYLFA